MVQKTTTVLRNAILDILAPGKVYKVSEIKEQLEIQKNLIYGVDYREGHFATLMRNLLIKKILISPQHGFYQKNDPEQEPIESMQEVRQRFFRSACMMSTYTGNLLKKLDLKKLTSKDVDILSQILECKEMFDEICSILGENVEQIEEL